MYMKIKKIKKDVFRLIVKLKKNGSKILYFMKDNSKIY